MYDLEAMKKAVEKCDENIKVFEQAIVRELATKNGYRSIVLQLEAKAKDRK